MNTWHIVTSEYPPDVGGVSDYCAVVAAALADAGDEVHVWSGSLIPDPGSQIPDPGSLIPDSRSRVHVHRTFGRFTPRDLSRVDRLLDRFPGPRRVLVQWVPHGYGYRSLNVNFCRWVSKRAKRGDRIEVMVHEPFLAFWEGSLRQNVAAIVHRAMTIMLARAATRIWVSIPAWERRWRPYTLGKAVPFEWLPIPNILPIPSCDAIRSARARNGAPDGGHLVGHLGTYSPLITGALMDALPTLLAISAHTNVMLFGRGSEEFRTRFAARHQLLALRVNAAGYLEPSELAERLASCDLLLQPYPDGISSRRTSAMAGLALGVPVATTRGRDTESIWGETACVALAGDSGSLAMTASRLLDNASERARLKAAALATYSGRFDIRKTVAALRRDEGA